MGLLDIVLRVRAVGRIPIIPMISHTVGRKTTLINGIEPLACQFANRALPGHGHNELIAFDDLLVAMGLARLQDLLIMNPSADLKKVPFQILVHIFLDLLVRNGGGVPIPFLGAQDIRLLLFLHCSFGIQHLLRHIATVEHLLCQGVVDLVALGRPNLEFAGQIGVRHGGFQGASLQGVRGATGGRHWLILGQSPTAGAQCFPLERWIRHMQSQMA
mmetsp:Transcript_56975/g.90283  ORF Transcript_56975/g.90283 Transcript_56975/m.90283 type:complete len:216 (+) Transcript_56975:543-1190(+)